MPTDYTPYYMKAASEALAQANAIDVREDGAHEKITRVVSFAQVYATLAVADATERQTSVLREMGGDRS